MSHKWDRRSEPYRGDWRVGRVIAETLVIVLCVALVIGIVAILIIGT